MSEDNSNLENKSLVELLVMFADKTNKTKLNITKEWFENSIDKDVDDSFSIGVPNEKEPSPEYLKHFLDYHQPPLTEDQDVV